MSTFEQLQNMAVPIFLVMFVVMAIIFVNHIKQASSKIHFLENIPPLIKAMEKVTENLRIISEDFRVHRKETEMEARQNSKEMEKIAVNIAELFNSRNNHHTQIGELQAKTELLRLVMKKEIPETDLEF